VRLTLCRVPRSNRDPQLLLFLCHSLHHRTYAPPHSGALACPLLRYLLVPTTPPLAPRCGSLCAEYLPSTAVSPILSSPFATPYATACSPAVGLPLASSFALHPIACPDAHALASFGLVTGEQACASEGTLGAAQGRIEYSCVRLGSDEDFSSSTFFSNCSAPADSPSLAALAAPYAGISAPLKARCPQDSALKSLELTTAGCSAAVARASLGHRGREPAGVSYRLRYECVRLQSETASVRGGGAWEEVTNRRAGGATITAGGGTADSDSLHIPLGGETGDALYPLSSVGAAQPLRARPRQYSAGSVCADAVDTFESLEAHQVACASGSHLVGSVGIDTAGCASVDASGAAKPEVAQARLLFQCVGSPHASGPKAMGVAMPAFEMVE
jgi:hypothetical protein